MVKKMGDDTILKLVAHNQVPGKSAWENSPRMMATKAQKDK
jgi:hypothetical protein